MGEELITITVAHYKRLLEDSEFLGCLEACGVDNWDGYGYAQEMIDEEGDE